MLALILLSLAASPVETRGRELSARHLISRPDGRQVLHASGFSVDTGGGNSLRMA